MSSRRCMLSPKQMPTRPRRVARRHLMLPQDALLGSIGVLCTHRLIMSARGQALPIRAFWVMSGLPPVATNLRTSGIGSFVPKPEVKAHPYSCAEPAHRGRFAFTETRYLPPWQAMV